KHGTSVETGLLVLDRGLGAAPSPHQVVVCETLADAARLAASLDPRPTAPPPKPHPSALVKSGPMASVAPPAPSYRPVLPTGMVEDGLVSDAQLETIIYAGEAHSSTLPGSWRLGEAAHQVILVADGTEGAVQFRRGFFL